MKIFECEFYIVVCPDGFGKHDVEVAAFTSYENAKLIAQELSSSTNWPHRARMAPSKISKHIFESAQEYRDVKDENEIKKKALAKLTDVERKVLGLE